MTLVLASEWHHGFWQSLTVSASDGWAGEAMAPSTKTGSPRGPCSDNLDQGHFQSSLEGHRPTLDPSQPPRSKALEPSTLQNGSVKPYNPDKWRQSVFCVAQAGPKLNVCSKMTWASQLQKKLQEYTATPSLCIAGTKASCMPSRPLPTSFFNP